MLRILRHPEGCNTEQRRYVRRAVDKLLTGRMGGWIDGAEVASPPRGPTRASMYRERRAYSPARLLPSAWRHASRCLRATKSSVFLESTQLMAPSLELLGLKGDRTLFHGGGRSPHRVP